MEIFTKNNIKICIIFQHILCIKKDSKKGVYYN